MGDGFEAVGFEGPGENEGVHADARESSAIDVNGIHFSRSDDAAGLFDDALDGDALGRIDLDGDDEFLFLDFAPELAVRFARGDTAKSFGRLEDFYGTWLGGRRAAVRGGTNFLHSFGEGANVFRRSSAAAADQARAQFGS